MRNGVDEIIAVVDVTDETCEAIARSYGDRGHHDRRPWQAGCPAQRLGGGDHPASSSGGLRHHLGRRRGGSECANHSWIHEVGGVGTRQNALDPAAFWQEIADMYLDYRYFDELAAQSVIGQCLSCLSGRTAVYRRDILLRTQ